MECEKQATGEACVRCRKYKHKCEFAKVRKPRKNVESDDKSSTAAPRKPRKAAKAAKKAIKRSSCKSIHFVLRFHYIYYNTSVSYKEEIYRPRSRKSWAISWSAWMIFLRVSPYFLLQ